MDAQVDHIDFDRSNDAPSNLRWLPGVENGARISPEKREARREYYRNLNRRLPLGSVAAIKRRYAEGARNVDVEREFGISASYASVIRTGVHPRRRGIDPRKD
jgi:hypothetical protein